MRDLNTGPSSYNSDAPRNELTEHTVTTRKKMYLTVKVSRRKNVYIKPEKC